MRSDIVSLGIKQDFDEGHKKQHSKRWVKNNEENSVSFNSVKMSENGWKCVTHSNGSSSKYSIKNMWIKVNIISAFHHVEYKVNESGSLKWVWHGGP